MGLLDRVTTKAPPLPSRVVMYAGEKAGKTSFACFAPNPLVLMTTGETGLLSLIDAGQVPPTAHLPPSDESPTGFTTWDGLTSSVEAVLRDPHDFRTLVLDTANGAENMLTAAVCQRAFNGDWAEFNSYGRGMAACVPEWGDFLRLLDEVRVRRKMSILFLHHARVKSFQNPTGKDWDQWKPEANDKFWSLTHKWADVITFFGSRVKVSKDDKAYGQEERFLRCTPSAAIVAGNRYGMPDEITAPAGARNLWVAFAKALQTAKAKAREQIAQQAAAAPPAEKADAPPGQAAANGTPAASPPPPVQASAPASPPPPPAEPAGNPDADPPAGGPDGAPPAKPQLGRQLVEEMMGLFHALGMTWGEVREEFAEDLGLTPDPVAEQDVAAVMSLRQVLKERVKEKEKRGRKGKPAGEPAAAGAEG